MSVINRFQSGYFGKENFSGALKAFHQPSASIPRPSAGPWPLTASESFEFPGSCLRMWSLFAQGFIGLRIVMIFIMLFGYWDHKIVSLFLEYLRTLKRKEKEEPLTLWKLHNIQAVTPSWERAGSASGRGNITRVEEAEQPASTPS